jgi:hypothetical protein
MFLLKGAMRILSLSDPSSEKFIEEKSGEREGQEIYPPQQILLTESIIYK